MSYTQLTENERYLNNGCRSRSERKESFADTHVIVNILQKQPLISPSNLSNRTLLEILTVTISPLTDDEYTEERNSDSHYIANHSQQQ
jgi:hypothetical protein